jgi:hypothetical protein
MEREIIPAMKEAIDQKLDLIVDTFIEGVNNELTI